MTHRGPFQPLLFCDSVTLNLISGKEKNRQASSTLSAGVVATDNDRQRQQGQCIVFMENGSHSKK